MPTNSSSIPTLVAQLQARYPAASLVAEFVTIHQESFVVRALVQAGGITLATGMAAAAEIEQAEDRAKIRALTALGIGGFTPAISSQPSTYSLPSAPAFSPAPEFLPAGGPSPTSEDLSNSTLTDLKPLSSPSLGSPPPQATAAPSPALDPPLPDPLSSFTTSANFAPLPQFEIDRPTPDYELNYEPESYGPDSYAPENYEADLDPPPKVEPDLETGSFSSDATQTSPPIQADASPPEPSKPAAPTGKAKSTKRKSDNIEIAPPSGETSGENDRSEEIAKIGLEMKRLGWTTEQGRNYLKRTYGKRSRQELDDSELMDFLRYLETQVSSF